MAPQLQIALDSEQDGQMLSVIVTLMEQADLSRIPGASRAARLQGIIRALQALAEASQKQIRALLAVRASQGKVSEVTIAVSTGKKGVAVLDGESLLS